MSCKHVGACSKPDEIAIYAYACMHNEKFPRWGKKTREKLCA